MDLSGLAGAFGAAFRGYGKDQADALARQELAQRMAGTDFDRTLRLRDAGFGPVSDVQQALQSVGQAPITTGVLPDSPVSGVATSGSDLAKAIAANVTNNRKQARELQTSVDRSFAVPGQSQPWAQLPFDQTPTGVALRKSLELDAAKQATQEKRTIAQQAAQQSAQDARAQATEVRTQQRAHEALSRAFPDDPLLQTPFDQHNPADYTTQLAHRYKMAEANAGRAQGIHGTVKLMGPDGKPHEYVLTGTGERGADLGLAAGTTGEMNPQQIGLGLRMAQGIKEMTVAHKNMQGFEKDYAEGRATFSGLDQFQSEFVKEFGNKNVTTENAVIKSAAMAHLNKTNPELAMYLRNGLYYAHGENEYQTRPSDFRTMMADMLATVGPDMNPDQIAQVTHMREQNLIPAVEAGVMTRARMGLSPDADFRALMDRQKNFSSDNPFVPRP